MSAIVASGAVARTGGALVTRGIVEAMEMVMKVFYGCLGILAVPIAGATISHLIQDDAAPPPAKLPSFPSPTADHPHEWYIADQDFTSCIKTDPPAKKIELLRTGGGNASTDESRDTSGNLISVEVSAPSADGLQSTVWTYYTSLDACQSELRQRNYVPEEYR